MRSNTKKKIGVSRHTRPDNGTAFLPDPGSGPAHVKDDLAEKLAEGFLSSAISGEETSPTEDDAVVAEEVGGPFVITVAKKEFAAGKDGSNPKGAHRAAFPTAMREGR